MRIPSARAVLVLSLVAAAVASVEPAVAFDAATLLGRDVSVSVVSDANAYNSVSAPDCLGNAVIATECTITLTNKGAAEQVYFAIEDPDTASVTRYRIGGSAWQTTEEAGPSPSISPGGTTSLIAEVPACLDCPATTAYFTIEGEKADTLSAIETRIRLTITYP